MSQGVGHRINSWLCVKIVLSAAALTFSAGCGWADIRLNVISGALGFVEGYTADLLAEWFPPPGEIVGGEE